MQKRLYCCDVAWEAESSGSREPLLGGVHIGATWLIQLNRQYVAAMRPYVTIDTYIAVLLYDLYNK